MQGFSSMTMYQHRKCQGNGRANSTASWSASESSYGFKQNQKYAKTSSPEECAPLATPERSLSSSKVYADISLDQNVLQEPDLQEPQPKSPVGHRSSEIEMLTSSPMKPVKPLVVSPRELNILPQYMVPKQTPRLVTMSSHSGQGKCCNNNNQSVLSGNSIICRICHEGEIKEGLVSPCKCTGTMGKIHITCAERWLSSANTNKCEICGTEYSTKHKPKPFIEWLRSPSSPGDKRNLVGDVMCFFLLTPLAIISDWLCISGAIHYNLLPETPRWQYIGLIILAVILALIYFVWCIIAIRYHVRIFRAWQRQNQYIKIVNGETSHPRGARCATVCMSFGDSLIDVNNNNTDNQCSHTSTPSLAEPTTQPSPYHGASDDSIEDYNSHVNDSYNSRVVRVLPTPIVCIPRETYV